MLLTATWPPGECCDRSCPLLAMKVWENTVCDPKGGHAAGAGRWLQAHNSARSGVRALPFRGQGHQYFRVIPRHSAGKNPGPAARQPTALRARRPALRTLPDRGRLPARAATAQAGLRPPQRAAGYPIVVRYNHSVKAAATVSASGCASSRRRAFKRQFVPLTQPIARNKILR